MITIFKPTAGSFSCITFVKKLEGINMSIVGELEQKKKLSRRKFILYEDRIAVEIKTAQTTSKYEVDVRDTGDKLYYHAENTTGGKVLLACIFFIPTIILTIMFFRHTINSGQLAAAWFCCFAVAFLAYIKENADDVYLTGGQKNLYFFRAIPSEEKVLEFIDLVKRTKKESLKNEHLAFDDETDEDEYYDKLKWLKAQNILTHEEYENAKIDFEIKRLLS